MDDWIIAGLATAASIGGWVWAECAFLRGIDRTDPPPAPDLRRADDGLDVAGRCPSWTWLFHRP